MATSTEAPMPVASTRIPVVYERDRVVRKPDAGPADVDEWMRFGLLAGFRRIRTRRQGVAR